MTNMLDYLAWRGDLSWNAAAFSPVDGLILSALSYIHLEEQVPPELGRPVTVAEAARQYLALPEGMRGRMRCEQDLALLRAMADAPRFSGLRLAGWEDRFEPERQMQFAAVTAFLPDGSAFLAFRGTDSTLVGWKEDFNMSFLDTVPAQEAALTYLERTAAIFPGPLRLGGHSKGGNLAVFAGSMCQEVVRRRILDVYNNDGPGFTGYVLKSPGYQSLLPRIHTFVPQFSVIGMLLEREEPHVVVKSSQNGIWQHDLYSWEVLGNDFVRMEEVTPGSRMTERTIKTWLAGLTPEERSGAIDAIYGFLSAGEANLTAQVKEPRNLYAVLRAAKNTDENTRRLLTDVFRQLARAAAETIRDEGNENHRSFPPLP